MAGAQESSAGRSVVARLSAGLRHPRLRQFVGSMAPVILALGVQLVAFAITARGLGVSQFGTYAALLALAAVGVELVGAGSGDLLARAVSRDVRSFPFSFGRMLRRIAETLGPVVLGFWWLAEGPMQVALSSGLIVTCLAAEIGVGRVSASLENVAVAHGHTVRAGWIRCVHPVCRLIVALLCFPLAGQSGLDVWITVSAVQALLVAVALIGYIAQCYGWPVFRLGGSREQDAPSPVLNITSASGHAVASTAEAPEVPAWATPAALGTWSLGLQYAATQTARALQSNIDRMALSRFATDAAALGAYAAGTRFLQLGTFPLQVVARMLNPGFYREGARGLPAVRQYALRKALPAMLGAGFLGAAAVGLGAWVAPLVLGSDYAEATRAAAWLATAVPFMALQYVAGDVLTGSDRQPMRTRLALGSTVVFAGALGLGAALGGVDYVLAAFIGGHALYAAVLGVAALKVR